MMVLKGKMENQEEVCKAKREPGKESYFSLAVYRKYTIYLGFWLLYSW